MHTRSIFVILFYCCICLCKTIRAETNIIDKSEKPIIEVIVTCPTIVTESYFCVYTNGLAMFADGGVTNHFYISTDTLSNLLSVARSNEFDRISTNNIYNFIIKQHVKSAKVVTFVDCCSTTIRITDKELTHAVAFNGIKEHMKEYNMEELKHLNSIVEMITKMIESKTGRQLRY